jgi:Flp pilus assembly pilin Flp
MNEDTKTTQERDARRSREEGQALVEYALILLLVALVTVGSLSAIGVSVSAAINAMAAGL